MTLVSIEKKQGHIVSVTADGHTGYGVNGEDIVCAALSSIIQTSLLGLISVAGIAAKFERRDDEGYLSFSLPPLEADDRKNADMILETMLCGIADLYESYSDFIELKVSSSN